VFNIDWRDMQLNLPNPFVPAQFYIGNAGKASSRGVELDVNARLHEELSVFGSVGLTRARFKGGSTISGVDVSGNKVPFTPEYTAMFGAEYLCPVNDKSSVFARAEVVGYGGFEYDDLNTARQEAYALTNFRAGVRTSTFFVEGWVRNAFDTKYVPIALAFNPSSAPSGFIGEPGRPRTFGIRRARRACL
jgi:iron complex outermembrane receptor protein